MRKTSQIIAVCVLFGLSGCASVISKGALVGVDRSVELPMAQANPALYAGRKIVWAGVIISTDNLEATSEIEVLEAPLGYDDGPEQGASKGRFLVESKGFLDPNVYKPGKGITVAGAIAGAKTRKIGKMDYLYPVVTPVEIKLFDMTKTETQPYPYPQPWMYDPFYTGPWGYPWGRPYDPFYDPYYPYRYPPPP
ncbi:MAG: Slp/YeaY family lipoprotein [Deltaproteobacteria bacterium]|nr:Slp/YeaY family lipoprotein [Deltaproteobacteria bacterium]